MHDNAVRCGAIRFAEEILLTADDLTNQSSFVDAGLAVRKGMLPS
jgi:hypothetical protein